MKSEREYEFSLILCGVHELDRRIEDALFEAGCDDATLSVQYGTISMDFARASPSLKDAILTAIRDVRKADIGADVWRVDESDLVTPSEIARRLGRSRQQIHQYMTGERGPGGFPAPECNLTEGAPLWDWYTVCHWLAANGMIRPEQLEDAETVAAINHHLEGVRQKARNPKLVAEVERAVAVW